MDGDSRQTRAADEHHVVFVNCPPWEPTMPHLSVAYLAQAATAAGFRSRAVDLNLELYLSADASMADAWHTGRTEWWWRSDILDTVLAPPQRELVHRALQEIADAAPLAVGFSTHSMNTAFVAAAVQRLRALGYRGLILLGGPAVRDPDPATGGARLLGFPPPDAPVPEAPQRLAEFIGCVDALVRGEGEQTLVELLQRYRDGGRAALRDTPGALIVSGGAVPPFRPRGFIADLDQLPSPTFREADVVRYPSDCLPVLLSRGCPRGCPMCFEHALWPTYRHRSPPQVVAELRHHIESHGVRRFHACDQATNGSLAFLEALCDAIIAAGIEIEIWGNAIITPGMTRALLDKMARAGFSNVIYGIESGSQRTLDRMQKRFTVADAERLLADTAAAGIGTNINLIVGYPGETERDFQRTLHFLERTRSVISRALLIGTAEVYLDTDLARRPAAHGIAPDSIRGRGLLPACDEWCDELGQTLAVRTERSSRLTQHLLQLGIAQEEEPSLDGAPPIHDSADELVGTLRTGDAPSRERAARAVHRLASPELIPLLRQALADESVEVRSHALLGLARLQSEGKVVAQTVERLHADDPIERRDAALTMAQCGGDVAFDHLEPLLSTEVYCGLDAQMQTALRALRRSFAIIETLRDRGPAGLTTQERARLCAGDACWLRLRAIEAVAGDDSALNGLRQLFDVGRLQRALVDGSVEVRSLALLDLARHQSQAEIVTQATKRVQAECGLERRFAAMTLAEIGDDVAFSHLEPLLCTEVYRGLDTQMQVVLRALRRSYTVIETLRDRGPAGLTTQERARLCAGDSAWLRLRAIEAVADNPDSLADLCQMLDVDQLCCAGLEATCRAVEYQALKALVALDNERSARLLGPYLAPERLRELPQAWQHTLISWRLGG